jgi:hypothetical protein
MIKIFKAHSPFNIFWLAVLLIILRVGYLYHTPAQVMLNFSGPISRLLVPVSYLYTFSPFYNIVIAALIIFIQALLVNFLVNHHNLLGKPTFLPALMYITVSGLFTPFIVLSPPLICNFLVIWMLFKLFAFYKSNDAKSPAYDLGMIIAIGSLIYLPFNYLFLAIWAALTLFKPFNWREWVAGIIGYATIFFFLAVYYYLNGILPDLYSTWNPLATKFPESIHINYYNYLVLIPVILILVLCFFKLQQNFFKSYVQVRKSFQLLFIIFLLAALTFYTQAAFQLNHFLLCAVPAAVFFSYYFLYAKGKWFYESLFLLLVIGIIYFQFNTF